MDLHLFSVDLDEVMQYRKLWLGSGIDRSPIYDGDRSDGAKHLIWIQGDKVAGIASIVPDMKKVGADNILWRLRAISIDPELRGKGVSEYFVKAVIAFAKRRNMYPVYGSSRINETTLYESLGAIVCENSYELNGMGSHVDFVFA